jgi:streptogramin lyase
LYVLGYSAPQTLYHYKLSTPWDVSTLTLSSSFDITTLFSGTCRGVDVSEDGAKLYLMDDDDGDRNIHYLVMDTPHDLTTAASVESLAFFTPTHRLEKFQFGKGGEKFYLYASDSDPFPEEWYIHQYTAFGFEGAWEPKNAGVEPLSSSASPTEPERVVTGPEYFGNQLFSGGCLLNDGRVLLPPLNNDRFAFYNPETNTIEEGSLHGLSNNSLFVDAVLMNDGRACIIPWLADAVWIFDPSDDSFSEGPALESSFDQYRGGVLADDGRVVLVPYEGPVGLFDPSDDSFTAGPTTGFGNAFAGGAKAGDGRIIFAPYDAGVIGIFDPSDDSFSSVSVSVSQDAYIFAATADDGRIVMCPYDENNVGLFDPSTDTFTEGPAHGAGTDGAYWGIAKVSDGRMILAPSSADVFCGVFDPSDDSFSTIGSPSDNYSQEYAGAVALDDDRVVLVKASHDTLDYFAPAKTDEYAIDFGDNVDEKYVVQGWFQTNTTSTPTLENTGGTPGPTSIKDRDGNDLWPGAIDGAHRLYRESSYWVLLDPVREPVSTLRQQSSDPADPPAGESVQWQSDGTGSGDDGDVMVKITDSGGTTKTITLVDFSTA